MAFVTTNPCLCSPCSQSAPAVDCPEVDENCLDVCDITILPTADEAVGPCGRVGTIDMAAAASHNVTLCTNGGFNQKWEVTGWDTAVISDASTTAAGVLSWVTAQNDAKKAAGNIYIKLSCGQYAAFGVVIVGIKDVCQDVVCNAPQACNRCTGVCEDQSSEIEVQTGTVSSENANVGISIQ